MFATVKPGHSGMTAQVHSAGINASSGAIRNRNLFELGGNDDFLDQQLQHVGERLADAHRPDAVRADARLDRADHAPLDQRQERHAQDDGDEQHQRDHAVPERPPASTAAGTTATARRIAGTPLIELRPRDPPRASRVALQSAANDAPARRLRRSARRAMRHLAAAALSASFDCSVRADGLDRERRRRFEQPCAPRR